jgi:hypothetical protein
MSCSHSTFVTFTNQCTLGLHPPQYCTVQHTQPRQKLKLARLDWVLDASFHVLRTYRAYTVRVATYSLLGARQFI